MRQEKGNLQPLPHVFGNISPSQFRDYMDLPWILRHRKFAEDLRGAFERNMRIVSDLVKQNKMVLSFLEEVGTLLEDAKLKFDADSYNMYLRKDVKDFKEEAKMIRKMLLSKLGFRLQDRKPHIDEYQGKTTLYLFRELKDGTFQDIQLILTVPSEASYGGSDASTKGSCYFKKINKGTRMVEVEDTEYKMVCPGDDDFDLEEALDQNEASAHHGLKGE